MMSSRVAPACRAQDVVGLVDGDGGIAGWRRAGRTPAATLLSRFVPGTALALHIGHQQAHGLVVVLLAVLHETRESSVIAQGGERAAVEFPLTHGAVDLAGGMIKRYRQRWRIDLRATRAGVRTADAPETRRPQIPAEKRRRLDQQRARSASPA